MVDNIGIDSLIANEFAVEINGEPMSGVFSVSGLVSFMLDSVGKRVYPSFSLSKMVQRNPKNPFNVWLQESQKGDKPTRDIAILAIDDGVPTRRWLAKGAYIKAVEYSRFDEASFEMVAETVEIAYETMEETFLTNG
ncbi:MAG: phage tail protein [Anaerolineae bacterium]|nr:phage tail protein [Anaerolineae bacterium]MCA9887643.1 phage tail protein [Anaerolineae bacterium]MCA9893277.1 phage tail protein [Anaerolineae bacterium]MCB9461358.1 phage tail protein [Anaerolineaceae bacterium]